MRGAVVARGAGLSPSSSLYSSPLATYLSTGSDPPLPQQQLDPWRLRGPSLGEALMDLTVHSPYNNEGTVSLRPREFARMGSCCDVVAFIDGAVVVMTK